MLIPLDQKPSEVIKIRRSVRTYSSQAFTDLQKQVITQLLQTDYTGPFKNKIRFHFVEKDTARGEKGIKLGTYGFINGANYFIAGEVKSAPYAFEDFGYAMEYLILRLTEIGLGTCWLGGTFSRSDFVKAAELGTDTVVACVTPVGIAASKTLKERFIRFGAGAENRKLFGELFFDGAFDMPLTESKAGVYRLPLDMVRIAPSASNRQPWRILINEHGVHLFLKRTPGYQKITSSVDLQRIDIGIAMAHFELGCFEAGIEGEWKPMAHPLKAEGMDYIISHY